MELEIVKNGKKVGRDFNGASCDVCGGHPRMTSARGYWGGWGLESEVWEYFDLVAERQGEGPSADVIIGRSLTGLAIPRRCPWTARSSGKWCPEMDWRRVSAVNRRPNSIEKNNQMEFWQQIGKKRLVHWIFQSDAPWVLPLVLLLPQRDSSHPDTQLLEPEAISNRKPENYPQKIILKKNSDIKNVLMISKMPFLLFIHGLILIFHYPYFLF